MIHILQTILFKLYYNLDREGEQHQQPEPQIGEPHPEQLQHQGDGGKGGAQADLQSSRPGSGGHQGRELFK